MFWTEERSKIAYTVPYAQQTISLTVIKGSPLKLPMSRRWPATRPGVEVELLPGALARGIDKEQVAKGAKPIEILTFKTADRRAGAPCVRARSRRPC